MTTTATAFVGVAVPPPAHVDILAAGAAQLLVRVQADLGLEAPLVESSRSSTAPTSLQSMSSPILSHSDSAGEYGSSSPSTSPPHSSEPAPKLSSSSEPENSASHASSGSPPRKIESRVSGGICS
ncbi:hypothetical protein E2562_023604 [Oryza meyeriana var. granulata]|uniref:Uncharacterized protein n=1 Tax=Oryza meyeriana var. granulata TaxID=110450 RepID=A0A6G1FBT4_9ORYZ|nr:hypothetical protein E2562_023604 [Oryza meyeriana var. granulata]